MKVIKNSDGWVLTWAPHHGMYFAPTGAPLIVADDQVEVVIQKMKLVCKNKDIHYETF